MTAPISRRAVLSGAVAGAVVVAFRPALAFAATAPYTWQVQQYDNYCSAAASRMMLSSKLGSATPTQRTLGDRLGLEPRNGADGLRISLSEFASRLGAYGQFQARSASASALVSDVTSSIGRGWPVVLSSYRRLNGSTPEASAGHYVCIVGYDSTRYLIACPAKSGNRIPTWIAKSSVHSVWLKYGHIVALGGSGSGQGAAGWTSIQQGHNAWRTSSLQYLLKQRGYYTLNVDGNFGPMTRDAVIRFQRASGLTADGVVGTQTWPRVIMDVRLGSSGNHARAAQTALNAYGAGLAVDGNFGSVSVAAAKRFQAANGRTQDGVVGPKTWEWLI